MLNFHAWKSQLGAHPPRVALIDDDPEMLVLLEQIFRSEGYLPHSYATGGEGLLALKETWDLILCDLRLPDFDGLQFIEKAHAMGCETPIILITAHASVETAAEALRKGAFDYVTKPVSPVELSVICGRAIQLHRLEREYSELRDKIHGTQRKGNLVGKSPRMRKLFDLIDRVAPSEANVLVTGESGTGKEMVAQAIHAGSPRADGPFVAINCSAIPDNLLESELFGHERGAFTGANEARRGLLEEAGGGTVFLDEIGDMPLALQAKLLRVLQERKIKPVGSNELKQLDIRIIAATHKELKKAVADGEFREDLFFRLCVVPIQIPPLRERSEDIPVLSEFFLEKYCRLNAVPMKRLTPAAISKLLRFDWPGNVRELENTIERAVVLSGRDSIDEPDVRIETLSGHTVKAGDLFARLPTLEELEREYIRYVLAETQDHKEKTAEILGINRKTLYRKEKEYRISPSRS